MAEIRFDFPVAVAPGKVFEAISTSAGLDRWWTLTSSGTPEAGARYHLGFGPGYQWTARVTRCEADREFELALVDALPDWAGTRVAFSLAPLAGGGTQVRFAHAGWSAETDHFRTTAFCWAMYLRVMRRALEYGESVPYAKRLDA